MSKVIATVVETFFEQQKKGDAWKIMLLSKWENLFKEIGTKITLEKMENDMVVLGVRNACWMHELYMLTPVLVDRINRAIGEDRIKNIRFKRAIFKENAAINYRFQKKKTLSAIPKKRALSDKEKKALSQIKNVFLAKALKQYLMRVTH